MRSWARLGLIILALALASCSGRGFTVAGGGLVSNSTWSDGRAVESRMTLTLQLPEDDSYSFRLVKDSLSWESPLTTTGGGIYTCELAITSGAHFPEGEYSCFVISSEGAQETIALTYHAEDVSGMAQGVHTDAYGNTVAIL